MNITYRIKSVEGNTNFQHVTLKVTPSVEADYFDMKGNYLGSTAKSDKNIFVLGLDLVGVPYSMQNIPKDFFDKNVSFTGNGNIVNLRAGAKYALKITDLAREMQGLVAKNILSYYYTNAGYDINELKYKAITNIPRGVVAFALARYGGATPNSEDLKEGEKDISVNFLRFGSSIITGWDAINLFSHERAQHMEDLIKYKKEIYTVFPGPYKIEHRAYMYQVKHSSWVKTTPEFKKQIWYAISGFVHPTEYEPYFKE